MYDFGLRLRELRKSRGLTQKMLAERINKSVSAVSSYESNAQLPPLDVSKSIALALGISIDYLVGNEATPIVMRSSPHALTQTKRRLPIETKKMMIPFTLLFLMTGMKTPF